MMPGGNFSFGRVFRLKMTYGSRFSPSAVQPSITVIRFFSCYRPDAHALGTFSCYGYAPRDVEGEKCLVHVANPGEWVVRLAVQLDDILHKICSLRLQVVGKALCDVGTLAEGQSMPRHEAAHP